MPNKKTASLAIEKLGAATASAIFEGLDYCKRAFEAIRENARVGITEIELKATIDKVMATPDGEQIAYLYVFSSGERTASTQILHESERVLKCGDPIFLDIWFQHKGHWVDVCRTFFLGEPSADARKMYNATLETISTLEKNLMPGIHGAALFAQADQVYSARGYTGYLQGHVGHRVCAQVPCIVPDFRIDGKEPVQAGMVLALEPGIQEKGVLGVRIEDNYLMTRNGPVDLFDYPRDLEYCIIDKK